MVSEFNNRLRQIVLLSLIILLALLLVSRLYMFLPGFLGALTLYFLQRDTYNRLVILKRWQSGLTAIAFILFSILLIALPVLFTVRMVGTRLSQFLSHAGEIAGKARLVGARIEEWTGFSVFSEANIREAQTKATSIVPALLNSSLGILSNFAIMFFLLYFLLRNGRAAERFLSRIIPLKPGNIEMLSAETRNMIRANAIGIPVLAVLQGLVATLGYALFGVEDYGLWGFMTGVCSLIPIVGTLLVWAPLVAYFFATGETNSGIGLLIYSLILIANIDHVARLTILRKFMDIHPLITIFGVIVGLNLFGFWGVIFGPLLISYFVILVKIYLNEFGKDAGPKIAENGS
jgi:predicted PurR-regulated permease PerM